MKYNVQTRPSLSLAHPRLATHTYTLDLLNLPWRIWNGFGRFEIAAVVNLNLTWWIWICRCEIEFTVVHLKLLWEFKIATVNLNLLWRIWTCRGEFEFPVLNLNLLWRIWICVVNLNLPLWIWICWVMLNSPWWVSCSEFEFALANLNLPQPI